MMHFSCLLGFATRPMAAVRQAGAAGIWEEGTACLVGVAPIPRREARAADVEVTHLAQRDRPQRVVQHEQLLTGTGAADRDHFVLACADRKSTRLNSSHSSISYAVFCLKKKNT